MKTYPIGESSIEIIEFRANETTYALVHKLKNHVYQLGSEYKTIILNQREILNLYQALQDEILKLGVLK